MWSKTIFLYFGICLCVSCIRVCVSVVSEFIDRYYCLQEVFMSYLHCLSLLVCQLYQSSQIDTIVCRRCSCLIYIVCLCLRIVVSNTYYVVVLGVVFFLLVCLRFVYSMMPVSLDCPFIEHPILEYTLYYSFVLDTADIVFRYMLVFLYFILYFVVFY